MTAAHQASRRLLRVVSALVAVAAIGLGLAAPTYADGVPGADQTTVATGTSTYILGDAPVAADAAALDAASPAADTTVLPSLDAPSTQAPAATWSTLGKARKGHKKHARSSGRRAGTARVARG